MPAPPRKRRKRFDENVIQTEPDKKRDASQEDEDDSEEDGTLSLKPLKIRTDANPGCREKGKRSRFFSLPPELRTVIYRYLLVSQAQYPPLNGKTRSKPIDLGAIAKYASRGGIETAILSVNRQIFKEASAILYTENSTEASIYGSGQFIAARIDGNKSLGAHRLRSGRTAHMMPYKGLIYEDVAIRLRNFSISVTFPSYHEAEEITYDAEWIYAVFRSFQRLGRLLSERASKQPKWAEPHSQKWVLTLSSEEEVGILALRIMLFPILNCRVIKLFLAGQFSMVVEDRMPQGWEKVLKTYVDHGAVLIDVSESQPDMRDPQKANKLLRYFAEKKSEILPQSLIYGAHRNYSQCGNCGGYHL